MSPGLSECAQKRRYATRLRGCASADCFLTALTATCRRRSRPRCLASRVHQLSFRAEESSRASQPKGAGVPPAGHRRGSDSAPGQAVIQARGAPVPRANGKQGATSAGRGDWDSTMRRGAHSVPTVAGFIWAYMADGKGAQPYFIGRRSMWLRSSTPAPSFDRAKDA